MKKWTIILTLVAIALTSMFALAQSKQPGIAMAEASPEGCLSCHKADTDTALAKVAPASHAKFSAKMMADIKGCYTCHAKRADMARTLHERHLVGADNAFVKLFGGYCTHCHAVDTASGAISLKGM